MDGLDPTETVHDLFTISPEVTEFLSLNPVSSLYTSTVAHETSHQCISVFGKLARILIGRSVIKTKNFSYLRGSLFLIGADKKETKEGAAPRLEGREGRGYRENSKVTKIERERAKGRGREGLGLEAAVIR